MRSYFNKMAAYMYNVFCGSETGLLKGINTFEKGYQNLNAVQDVDKTTDEIEIMCWSEENSYEQLCCGLKNRSIKTYNRKTGIYENVLNVDCGKGSIKGLSKYNRNFITCVESGVVKVFNDDSQENKLEFNVGENIYRMRHNSFTKSQIATGGKENEVKLWDLENVKAPIFKAKNVKRDSLDLRVPVWVTDIQFMSEGRQIVTGTGYHQIRVYDTRTSQKRPIIDFEFDEYPLTSISVANQENYLIGGNSRGRMALFDLRKKLLVHCFKGVAGSIRSIQCHPTLSEVASCGLDRFLRIHDIQSHKLLKKYYLKSRLNCLLFTDENPNELPIKQKQSNEILKNINDTNDDLWGEMEQASDDETSKVAAKNKIIERKRKFVKAFKNQSVPVINRKAKPVN